MPHLPRRWSGWIVAIAASAGLGSCAGTAMGGFVVTGMSPLAGIGAQPPRLAVSDAPALDAPIDVPRYIRTAQDAAAPPDARPDDTAAATY